MPAVEGANHVTYQLHTEPLQAADPSLQLHQFSKRQNAVIIPTLYSTNGASPGTVVAIIFGAVIGFIAVIWLFSAIGNMKGTMAVSEEVVRREPGHRSRRSHTHARGSNTHHHHAGGGTRHRSRSNRATDRGRIIREEHIVPVREVREIREIRKTPIQPPARRSSGYYDVPTVRRVEGDDIVEVYEEETIVTNDRKKRHKKRADV